MSPVAGNLWGVVVSAGAENTGNGREGREDNSPSNEGPTDLIADVDASLPHPGGPRAKGKRVWGVLK